MSERIEELYSRKQFEQLLKDAEAGAETEREELFVADMQQRFEEYGMRMYLSDAQEEWLKDLAER
jgi:hypothetical protein